MTGRERLTAMLNGKPKDRVPWTTLVDGITRGVMSAPVRELSVLDFYKHIGCDIFQFGNYGLEPENAVKYPYRMKRPDVEESARMEAEHRVRRTLRTPWGTLETVIQSAHQVKYPVETIEDLRILKKVWENTEYVPDTQGCRETYERIDALIGDGGVYIPIVAPSALQTLLEEDIGTKNFYYMYSDYPEEVTELVELIHDRRKQEYRIIAEHMPFIGCISVENTSTTYISPPIYRRFSQRHMADFVGIMHGRGKKGILHMCGHVNRLLPDFIPTCLDGIHALTPPPVGDTPLANALDALGEGLFIVTAFGYSASSPDYSRGKLWREIDAAVTPRLRRANVLFGLGADGLAMPEDRFYDTRDWFVKYGSL